MSDLIDRDEVIEIIESVCSADDTYWKPGTLEKIRNLPIRPTPSNTLGALDCVSRQDAIDALAVADAKKGWRSLKFSEMHKCLSALPSVHPEFSNNSKELENKKGELISRQKAIDAISKKQGGVFDQDAEIDTAILYVYSECKAIIKDLPSVQPRKGKWLDYSDEGYVECPFCHSATNCDGNKDELHYCFSCGADMREGDAE